MWSQIKRFQPQYRSQRVHLLCYHIRCHTKRIHSISSICKTKGFLLLHGSNSKWSYSFSNVLLHIQCVVAFSIVINIFTRLAVHRHRYNRTKKLSANWTHPIFQIALNSRLNASYGIPRGYFHWKKNWGSLHSWQLFDATIDNDSFCQIISM